MSDTGLDPRASRSRRALLDAAISLFLQNPAASLSDVAQTARVGRATLYRHFSTREQLIRELAIESLQETDAVLKPIHEAGLSARQTLERGLVEVIRIADRFRFLLSLWSIVEGDDEVEHIYQRQLDDLVNLINAAKAEGAIDNNLSTAWIVSLVDSLIYAGWWAIQKGEMSAQEAGAHAVKVLFDGVAPVKFTGK